MVRPISLKQQPHTTTSLFSDIKASKLCDMNKSIRTKTQRVYDNNYSPYLHLRESEDDSRASLIRWHNTATCIQVLTYIFVGSIFEHSSILLANRVPKIMTLKLNGPVLSHTFIGIQFANILDLCTWLAIRLSKMVRAAWNGHRANYVNKCILTGTS